MGIKFGGKEREEETEALAEAIMLFESGFGKPLTKTEEAIFKAGWGSGIGYRLGYRGLWQP